jgi:uncharacterized protein
MATGIRWTLHGSRLVGTAMITGASSGIGAAFAERLALAGFDLVLVARREDKLRELAGRLARNHGVSADILVADLCEPAALAATEARLGACAKLSLLVNSAGACKMGEFSVLDSSWVDTHLKLNALAPARLCHAALRKFGGRGPAGIINVSSLAASMPSPHAASYSASKSYLSTLSWCLAGECAGTQVRVQDLRAGMTRTDFPERAGVRMDAVPSFAWAEPEEVAIASLAALSRNQVVCVPRVGDRLVPGLVRMLPLRLARELGRFTASGGATPGEAK